MEELREMTIAFQKSVCAKLDRIIELQRTMCEKIDRDIEESRKRREEFRAAFDEEDRTKREELMAAFFANSKWNSSREGRNP